MIEPAPVVEESVPGVVLWEEKDDPEPSRRSYKEPGAVPQGDSFL